MLVLGVNAYHGDASAAALVDGRLVAAAEEERFNRIKHAAGFPAQALRYVVAAAGTSLSDVRTIAVARDPWARAAQKALYAFKLPRMASGRLRNMDKFTRIADTAAQALELPAGQIEVRRVEHHK